MDDYIYIYIYIYIYNAVLNKDCSVYDHMSRSDDYIGKELTVTVHRVYFFDFSVCSGMRIK